MRFKVLIGLSKADIFQENYDRFFFFGLCRDGLKAEAGPRGRGADRARTQVGVRGSMTRRALPVLFMLPKLPVADG